MPLIDGRKVLAHAGTREPLAAARAVRSVVVTADISNAGVIVVGGTTVVASPETGRRGCPLNPGDQIAMSARDDAVYDLASIMLDASADNDFVTWIAGVAS